MNVALADMKQFFFDLAGDLFARDAVGHTCKSKREARQHAAFIAARIGTEHPDYVKPGNRIEVRDEKGVCFQVPISTTARES